MASGHQFFHFSGQNTYCLPISSHAGKYIHANNLTTRTILERIIKFNNKKYYLLFAKLKYKNTCG